MGRLQNLKAKNRQKKKEKASKEQEIVRYEVDRVRASYKEGLTDEQVEERVQNGWSNVSVDANVLTVKEIIRSNVFTYFNAIFFVLAVLLVIARSFRDLTFLPVIIANTLIGIVQELRAKSTLDALTVLNAPKVTAVRNGKKVSVPSEELVLDDIVLFTAGNQIPADAVVIHGEVMVNESLLTGESDDVPKKRGSELMSGSFIVSGRCYGRLEKVGADSYVSQLTLQAKSMDRKEQSEMIRSLDSIVRFVGIALIPIGLILLVQGFFFNKVGLSQSITSMVAAVLGMIPEGLYLLASVALAVSAMRLASQKVLLHNMKSIETLARVNVLCVDKTGTITEPKMKVFKMIPIRSRKSSDARKDEKDSDGQSKKAVLSASDVQNMYSKKELLQLLSDFVGAMADDNITMAAMKEHFTDLTGRRPKEVFGFSSAYKYSGVAYEREAFVVGAPEFVLRSDFSKYEKYIEKYTSKGYRLLVFAKYFGELNGKALTKKAVPLAYVLLQNPIRKEAPETFQYFADQGVEVKVISGDNPVTVSEVAKQANIQNADKYIDASLLDSREKLYEAASEYTVFGRVTPKQKRMLVHALQKAGNTVAMTGDGVNDVLALKDADCSVAMASGSDAAVQAAQVVLLESNFACMPDVVLEGRRVVNNIQRSASLFLVKNIFSFLLAIFSAFAMITYPLEPSQISLISMFTIGTPGFLLAFQPNHERIEGNFMANVFLKALPAALVDVLSVAALVVFGQTFGVDSTDISTASTMLLAIVGFMILFKICSPMNRFRSIIAGICIVGFLGSIFIIPDLFKITGMSTRCVMLFVLFAIATEPLFRYLTKLVSWCQETLAAFLRGDLENEIEMWKRRLGLQENKK